MGVTIEFLGHAGFVIDDGEHRLAIDPFLEGNPVAVRKPLELRCSAVAVTHGHADHFGDVLTIAKARGATVYSSFEICNLLQEQGHQLVEPGNPGGRIEAPFGWVAFTQAFHSSSYEGRYMGQPMGVVAHIGGVTVYHLGDTALFGDLKLIGELYRPDVCMIPVGDRFTMGPEHGRLAAEWLRPRLAIPCHYGTWPLLVSDIGAFRPEGVEVRAMKAGETITVEADA